MGKLLVMVSDRARWARELDGRFPGRDGNLYAPPVLKTTQAPIVWVVDNGRFGSYKNRKPWDRDKYLQFMDRVLNREHPPAWGVVPDVVGDRMATLRDYDRWVKRFERWGLPPAVAVQDGMTPADVRLLSVEPVVVFVGGTIEWKWRTARTWVAEFPRVHLARVGSPRKLWMADRLGVESIDGTCWFRYGRREALVRYLDRSNRGLDEHHLKGLGIPCQEVSGRVAAATGETKRRSGR